MIKDKEFLPLSGPIQNQEYCWCFRKGRDAGVAFYDKTRRRAPITQWGNLFELKGLQRVPKKIKKKGGGWLFNRKNRGRAVEGTQNRNKSVWKRSCKTSS